MQTAIEYELAKKSRLGVGKVVLLDRFYNNEYKTVSIYHYTWRQNGQWFSWFGSIFKDYGAKLKSLDDRPTEQNLAEADVYIIVDPDHKKTIQHGIPSMLKMPLTLKNGSKMEASYSHDQRHHKCRCCKCQYSC